MDSKKKTDSLIKTDVQRGVLVYLNEEFSVASRNAEKPGKLFDTYYDMLHSIRDQKRNDWESDIALPEFPSRILTQIGGFASQYFGSRDFVEPDIDSDDPQDMAEAKAAKKLLNTLLNDRDAHYYPKVIRVLMFAMMSGYGIIKGGYEQDVETVIDGYDERQKIAEDDEGNLLAEDGTLFADPYTQRPVYETEQIPREKTVIHSDRPIFDVYPVQNVYMDNKYAYSLQDKEYVIFESEASLNELKADADRLGYFNLHLLGDTVEDGYDSERTYNRTKDEESDRKVITTYTVLERWGKFPVIVTSTDGEGEPLEYKPGFTKDGEIDEKAELYECIVTSVKDKTGVGIQQLIRFQISPHSRRPMCRFQCYIDPLKDSGFGDGELVAEIQRAINDNYNLMNYRTRLAITPAFKYKRFSGLDGRIRLSPEEGIPVENMDDIMEFQIADNIQGGVVHHNLLSSRMDYCMATSPQTMGQSPERRETATQASIVADRANVRIGMKSMNFEFTGFAEFYDMMLTLVNDFMLPETLEEILGAEAYSYNPQRKDKFKPVSQALETEDSKNFKVRMWDQVLGRVSQIPNPKTPMVINYILGQILELMGGNFKQFKKFMFEESPEAIAMYQIATGAKGPPMQQMPEQNLMPPQNQMGMPQGAREQQVRM